MFYFSLDGEEIGLILLSALAEFAGGLAKIAAGLVELVESLSEPVGG